MHSVTYRTQLLRYINLKITEHCYYTDVEYVVYPLQYVKRIYISHVPVYCYRIGINDQSTGYMGIRKHFKDHTLVLKHIFELYDKTQDKEEISSKWIYYRLITEVSNHYHYLCMLKMSLSHWRLLKKFDKTVRANKKIYKDSSKRSRFVRWLRKSQFLLYPVCYLRAKQNT